MGKRCKAGLGSGTGFTLPELVVVIAILAILVALLLPGYSGYLRKAANARVEVELEAISKTVLIAAVG